MRIDATCWNCYSKAMRYWTELRTALMLARLGTVSAAAEALGVHRATVNRHIDTLEGEFQAPLFQRHARGYTLTDMGNEMLEIVGRADEMFSDLSGRSRGQAGRLSGTLVVTALAGVAPLVMPAIRAFHLAFPQIKLEFDTGTVLARLEHGEAHVAFRAGPKPETPDYVVKSFRHVRFGLYASRDYVSRRGQPARGDFEGHAFIGPNEKQSRLPYADWMKRHLASEQYALTATDPLAISGAVKEGIGIGFLAEHEAADDPDLVVVHPPSEEWSVPIWIVTHVDLHRTEKIQAFLGCI